VLWTRLGLAQDRDKWKTLVNVVMNFGFHQILENSQVAKWLVASRVLYCIVLYLFQIPSNSYTGQRTSHKPQDIESVITIQYNMFQQKNVST
jgi:hypothetical protein